jgi:hypothetical protein
MLWIKNGAVLPICTHSNLIPEDGIRGGRRQTVTVIHDGKVSEIPKTWVPCAKWRHTEWECPGSPLSALIDLS